MPIKKSLPVLNSDAGGRCTGHCCRKFYLPASPEELRTWYEDWMASCRGVTVPERLQINGDVQRGRLITDIHLIYPMVRYLGHFAKDPNGKRTEKPAHYYSCKHLLPNGDCSIYEIRPSMCRDFPYGKRCPYKVSIQGVHTRCPYKVSIQGV